MKRKKLFTETQVVLLNAIELIKAKTELVKAETELEKTKQGYKVIAPSILSAMVPYPFVQAQINKARNEEENEMLQKYLEEFKARYHKTVVSESNAALHRLECRIKALEDQIRNFKVKELEVKQDKPEMKLVDEPKLNKPCLAVNKKYPNTQCFGEFFGIEDGTFILKFKESTSYVCPSDFYFFEVVIPDPEAKEESKPEESEPLISGIEKSWLIKKLEKEKYPNSGWLSPFASEREWQIAQLKKLYPDYPHGTTWQYMNGLIHLACKQAGIEAEEIKVFMDFSNVSSAEEVKEIRDQLQGKTKA